MNMKFSFSRLIQISMLLFLALPVAAQLNQGGIPLSFSLALRPEISNEVALSPPDMVRLEAEDIASPVPFRFAENIPVDLGIGDFSSMVVHGDKMVRRLTITAKGAKGLSLYFDKFALPESGKLFVYNPGRTQLMGAFTSLNNNTHGTFAVSVIHGETITLEYNAPAGSPLPDLHLNEVAYAYRGVSEEDGPMTGFGSSGKCEVNVNCQEGSAWQAQKRGVTRIQIKRGTKTLFCTGSLVNNTLNDGKPYILTADHCGSQSSDTDITQWIFYFGYESSACPKPSKEPWLRSMTGATRIAHGGENGSNGSDFFLVRLNKTIPDSFSVYYNGWSREVTASPSGVSIHHPEGDIKKISTYTQPLQPTFWPGDTKLAHWRVTWSGTTNGHGTTEPGSSGSPLFDNQGRIVGTLTGGDSSCDSARLFLPDYYGQFAYHWEKNGADSASQLKPWLDPIGADVMSVNGWALSTEEKQVEERVLISPNPVVEVLTLTWHTTGNRDSRIIITDLSGRTIIEETTSDVGIVGARSINTSDFRPGLYFVTIISGHTTMTGKFIKVNP
jgi:hypothetical protein